MSYCYVAPKSEFTCLPDSCRLVSMLLGFCHRCGRQRPPQPTLHYPLPLRECLSIHCSSTDMHVPAIRSNPPRTNCVRHHLELYPALAGAPLNHIDRLHTLYIERFPPNTGRLGGAQRATKWSFSDAHLLWFLSILYKPP